MITIIETGTTDTEIEARHGDYVAMFDGLLAPHGLQFETVRLVRGEALPNSDDVEAVLITGSRHGVYDQIEWIEPLKEFIRAAAKRRVPMVGVCFGHQIIAEALGGKVEKSTKGWGLGVNEYQVSENPYLPKMPDIMRIQAIHQDQVIEKPADAQVFAGSEFCEYAGLVYGGDDPFAVTVQPHPEFSAEFVGEIVSSRRGKVYPEARADDALATINAPINSNEWGAWIASFFKARLA